MQNIRAIAGTSPGCVLLNDSGVIDNVNGTTPSLACLIQIVVNIINFALMFLGVVTLLMLLFGAIKFITSSGDPKAIQGAQKTMTYAIIGAIVVMMAFVLINIVTNALGLSSSNILSNFSFYQSGP